MVICPSFIFFIINSLIYIKVRLLTRRVRSSVSLLIRVSGSEHKSKISQRDVRLLRHMIIMFSIFIGGWTPLYLLLAIENAFYIHPILLACFTIWCELALLCDIIDLYLYNHELRKYLQTIFSRCMPKINQT
ncbi:unnamed protein product [Adineta steineri]|uniref:G-protein coupled receptors family 1 profile domain-containing protein n=1 Tax=Adineta steineri TaxID=433720 RepID=A0A818S9F3_9BILA|nr:unnamed protein product [Adineta steineri]CAF3669543.1 unnamed protein product [Adineta steineri]